MSKVQNQPSLEVKWPARKYSNYLRAGAGDKGRLLVTIGIGQSGAGSPRARKLARERRTTGAREVVPARWRASGLARMSTRALGH